jgi:glutathione peroxidase
MSKQSTIGALTILMLVLTCSCPPLAIAGGGGQGIYSFTVKNIDGESVPLSKYEGKVLLIVNTASLCGNTPQYASLEKLYQQYASKGLCILAFPENDFHNQEPGDNLSIRQFCTAKYNVTFDLFSKIDVIGANQAPLYKYLTDKSTDPNFGAPIEWNFAKFCRARSAVAGCGRRNRIRDCRAVLNPRHACGSGSAA